MTCNSFNKNKFATPATNSTQVEKRGSVYYSPMSEELWKAIEDDDLSEVQRLIAKGAIVNSLIYSYQSDYGDGATTPLNLSISLTHNEIAFYLLDQGAEIEAFIEGADAPMFDAVFANNLEIAKWLLGKGAGVNRREDDSEHSEVPLHAAAESGHLEMIKLLVDKGADLNAASGWYGWTALHLAVTGGHNATVAFLLDAGADLNLRDKNGNIPLDLAIEKGLTKIALILRVHSAKQCSHPLQAIYEVVTILY